MIHTHTFEIEGKTFFLESGRIAKQAGGAVLLGLGETIMMGTATMSKGAREGLDFLPLVCDFEERKYAIGKIPGGYIKRGGRPSERAILASRLMDRPIRPLFPKGMRNEIQVIAMPFSVDNTFAPDILGITAGGAALAVSDIPFNGPVAGVRVGRIDGKFVAFPTREEMEKSDLDLLVAGHKGAISMVEAGASEVSEKVMIDGLKYAHKVIVKICKEIEKFAKKAGKPKRDPVMAESDETLSLDIAKKESKLLRKALTVADKADRESGLDELSAQLREKYGKKIDPEDKAKLKELDSAIDGAIKKTVRELILKDGIRPDGRATTEIRNLEAEVGLIPRVHGSGLFTRGQTQVLSILTLGMPGDAQKVDNLDETETEKRYMHFYNFPPYSVGEARPLRGPGRREIGHGALAERALLPVVPLDDPDFPYTVLIMSEVLESNGSTSMASVCGSTLCMMDAGVPLLAPVAGIAMGLVAEGDEYQILTDIQGMEDFLGDMDFKVAGTRKGITALQLDTKLDGIEESVLAEALNQALDARLQILDVMEEAISAPRPELAPTAPRLTTIQIATEKIGALIGPGGATIRKIVETTGCQVDVQQDGRVIVGSSTGTAADEAVAMIKALTASVEVGAEFTGPVTRLFGRGAMVEYMPGKEGLVPTDSLTTKRISRPDDAVQIGDVIKVRVAEVDSQGRINLSAAGLNPEVEEKAVDGSGNGNFGGGDRGGRGGGGGFRGGRDRDRGGRGGGDRGGYDRGGRGRDRDRDRDRGGYDRGGRDEEASGREDRPAPRDRGSRDQNEEAPPVPDRFPGRNREDDDDVNTRFRPRR